MKNYAILFCTSALAACFATSKGQTIDNFTPKQVPAKYRYADKDKIQADAELNNRFPNAYDLTKCLPANYVTDGTVDYTSYLQEAIKTNAVVFFPDFPVLINGKGLWLKSNSTVVFRPKSALLLVPTDAAAYGMLRIVSVKNVNVYYPVLVGDREQHTGTKGEWGMGIYMTSSQNIKIYDPKISKCWGDGIYIAGTSAQNNNQILITNPQLDYNRRNGISIISGKNISIINGIISNTSGTAPMSGVDFEPDNSNAEIDSVSLKNLVTYNNEGSGILISLSRLPAQQEKHVNIDIDGHVDEKSNNAFWLGGFYDSYKNGQALKGNITVTNSKWIDNKLPFKANDNYQFAPNVTLKNNSILKSSANGYNTDELSLSAMKKALGAKPHIKVQ